MTGLEVIRRMDPLTLIVSIVPLVALAVIVVMLLRDDADEDVRHQPR